MKKSEFKRGLIWNYVSTIIMAISGLLCSTLIAVFYDATILGIFNQVQAWYVIFSQITVWGIHRSVTKYIPENIHNAERQKEILNSALVLTIGISILAMIGLSFVVPVLSRDEGLIIGVRSILPALGVFSCNKVILAYFNGLSRMRIYAVLQSLRNILISASLICFALLGVPGVYTVGCFFITETILFFVQIAYLVTHKLLGGRISKEWLQKHFLFGAAILPANLVLEFNTKIDIICLGVLLRDNYSIGIYSFAILFAEGFYQFYIVVRRSINPHITEAYLGNEFSTGFYDIYKKVIKISHIVSPIFVVLLGVGYWCVCSVLQRMEYIEGLAVLIVVAGAIAVNGVSIIFGNIFSQIGQPIKESVINLWTVCCNILFNVVMIPYLGIMGAGIATALSYFAFSVMLKRNIRKIPLNL